MGGVGAAFTLSSCASIFGQSAVVPTKVSQNSQNTGSSFVPDVELALRATPSQVSIFAGNATNVWTYQGEVLTGDASTLQMLEGSYLGPIIRVRTGQKVRQKRTNWTQKALSIGMGCTCPMRRMGTLVTPSRKVRLMSTSSRCAIGRAPIGSILTRMGKRHLKSIMAWRVFFWCLMKKKPLWLYQEANSMSHW